MDNAWSHISSHISPVAASSCVAQKGWCLHFVVDVIRSLLTDAVDISATIHYWVIFKYGLQFGLLYYMSSTLVEGSFVTVT